MKIAVTAATGHLGALIVDAAVAMVGRESVVAIARSPSKAKALGVEVRKGDYNDGVQLEEALSGIDAVLLVSGKDAPEKRIEQHRNVIGAAVTTGVKKIVYSSVQGADEGNSFSPIVQSNRKTEEDIKSCGLDWAIGRNGIYIEPDVEYIETYKKDGAIRNCAGDGKCGYTTRPELGYAYARMITEDKHNGHTYNLHGEAITQYELADYLNSAFGTDLAYTPLTVDEYREDRTAELGEFMGTIIAGIYQGVRDGESNNPSHYSEAAGREHVSWPSYFAGLVD